MSLSKSYETAVRAFLRIEMTPAQIDSAERQMMGRLRKKATAEGHRPPERMVIALWRTDCIASRSVAEKCQKGEWTKGVRPGDSVVSLVLYWSGSNMGINHPTPLPKHYDVAEKYVTKRHAPKLIVGLPLGATVPVQRK